ncbi:hypothetical protein CI610_01460 [invertebrate metagenome]|uniref:RING-type domain-containing protein n=1 Tax=invertebrate metagenome TaxID=1711999 RepID=A0A2H9T8I7_9ZZZZ
MSLPKFLLMVFSINKRSVLFYFLFVFIFSPIIFAGLDKKYLCDNTECSFESDYGKGLREHFSKNPKHAMLITQEVEVVNLNKALLELIYEGLSRKKYLEVMNNKTNNDPKERVNDLLEISASMSGQLEEMPLKTDNQQCIKQPDDHIAMCISGIYFDQKQNSWLSLEEKTINFDPLTSLTIGFLLGNIREEERNASTHISVSVTGKHLCIDVGSGRYFSRIQCVLFLPSDSDCAFLYDVCSIGGTELLDDVLPLDFSRAKQQGILKQMDEKVQKTEVRRAQSINNKNLCYDAKVLQREAFEYGGIIPMDYGKSYLLRMGYGLFRIKLSLMPENKFCKVCLTNIRNVELCCKHTFCGECVSKLGEGAPCPLCRKNLKVQDVDSAGFSSSCM